MSEKKSGSSPVFLFVCAVVLVMLGAIAKLDPAHFKGQTAPLAPQQTLSETEDTESDAEQASEVIRYYTVDYSHSVWRTVKQEIIPSLKGDSSEKFDVLTVTKELCRRHKISVPKWDIVCKPESSHFSKFMGNMFPGEYCEGWKDHRRLPKGYKIIVNENEWAELLELGKVAEGHHKLIELPLGGDEGIPIKDRLIF